MVLLWSGLPLWAALLSNVVFAQKNQTTHISGDLDLLDLSATETLPIFNQEGFSFSGVYDPNIQWDIFDDTARVLLEDAYEFDFSQKPPHEQIQPGARYNSFHGNLAEFVVALDLLYSQGVQATWSEVQEALEILKDQILSNQWRHIGRSPCQARILLNGGPLFSITFVKQRGRPISTSSSGALMGEGSVFTARRMSFPNAQDCLLKEIDSLSAMEATQGQFMIREGWTRNRDEGLVHMTSGYRNFLQEWPDFTVSDVIELLKSILAWLRLYGRADGFGFEIKHGLGPDQIVVGEITMNQEYIAPIEALRDGLVLVGNMSAGDAEMSNGTLNNSIPGYGGQDIGNGTGHAVLPGRHSVDKSGNVIDIS